MSRVVAETNVVDGGVDVWIMVRMLSSGWYAILKYISQTQMSCAWRYATGDIHLEKSSTASSRGSTPEDYTLDDQDMLLVGLLVCSRHHDINFLRCR